jgi:hypothetical protein
MLLPGGGGGVRLASMAENKRHLTICIGTTPRSRRRCASKTLLQALAAVMQMVLAGVANGDGLSKAIINGR